MEDLFQRPLAPISMIPHFSKKILVKAEIPKLSSKKNLRSFHENWRRTGLSLFTLFTCSLVLKDLNEALWISNNLTNYLSLFTLFTLFTCSQGFQWSFLNLNSFGEVFEFVHLVHLFMMIWIKLSESQFIWLSIWVCTLFSTCPLVLDDMNEVFWNSIHLTKYLSLLTLFTLFICSWRFEWRSMNLNSFDQVFEFVHFVHLFTCFQEFEWRSVNFNSFDKVFEFVHFVHSFTCS